MRTIQQIPVIRVVRSQRPYSSARELWKERMARDRRQPPAASGGVGTRRSAVEGVPEKENAECDHVEGREPMANECGPLRYSEYERGESITEDGELLIRHKITDGKSSLLNCASVSDDSDQEEMVEGPRVSLVALLKTTISPSNHLAAQGSGDVTTIDERLQALSMARQQERRRAQRALKDEKSVATRRRVLMTILGMKRFYKTLSLVREIKGTREKLLLQCSIDPGVSCIKKVVVCKVKFDNLPRSARDLMARTHLVSAVEQTEIERLRNLPWDELIAQAQANLFAYREWMSISETRE